MYVFFLKHIFFLNMIISTALISSDQIHVASDYLRNKTHLLMLYVFLKNISAPREVFRNPCNPSPCGPNAVCKERNGAGACTCIDDFYGDPYLGCRPECVMNTDCATDRTCFNNKCLDPCPGSCGKNAECRVFNHAPSCFCLPGYKGNPLHACSPTICKIFFLSF